MVNKMRGPGVMDSCYNWNRCQAIGIAMERRKHVGFAIRTLDADRKYVTNGLEEWKIFLLHQLTSSASIELDDEPPERWTEVRSRLGQ